MALKVLVDEMDEKWVDMLRERGFDAYSARSLKEKHNISADYSIIKYASDNRMLLVTRDKESGAGCREQGIPYLLLDNDLLFELVLSKLDEYR